MSTGCSCTTPSMGTYGCGLPAGSRQFHAAAGSADKTLKLYDGHAHDLLNDAGRETVMADIKGWIEAHLSA